MGLAGDPKLRHLGLPGLGGDVQEDWWKAAVPSTILKGETAWGGARWDSGPSPQGVRKQLRGGERWRQTRNGRSLEKCDLGPFRSWRASEPDTVPPLQAPSPAKPLTRFCGETVNLGRWGAGSQTWAGGCVCSGEQGGCGGAGTACIALLGWAVRTWGPVAHAAPLSALQGPLHHFQWRHAPCQLR